MSKLLKSCLQVCVAVGLLCAQTASWSAPDKQLRMGTLAPKNSLYHRQLMEVGEVWRNAQGGNAKFVVYPDGSQGGETELARRMRIGQLQGALLSVVGLREIERGDCHLESWCSDCHHGGNVDRRPTSSLSRRGKGAKTARQRAL